MIDIIEDWVDFCENKREFDKSHFYTLFWEDIDDKKIKKIFKNFPKSDLLYEKVRDYMFGNKFDFFKLLNRDIKEVSVELALADISEKKKLLIGNEKLLNLLNRIEVEFIPDFDFVLQLKAYEPYTELFDEIEFQLTEKWILNDKKANALYEALYGLSKSYEMTWYLFAPLIDTNVNFKYYFDLTRFGGAYSFKGNKLLVSHNPDIANGFS